MSSSGPAFSRRRPSRYSTSSRARTWLWSLRTAAGMADFLLGVAQEDDRMTDGVPEYPGRVTHPGHSGQRFMTIPRILPWTEAHGPRSASGLAGPPKGWSTAIIAGHRSLPLVRLPGHVRRRPGTVTMATLSTPTLLPSPSSRWELAAEA